MLQEVPDLVEQLLGVVVQDLVGEHAVFSVHTVAGGVVQLTGELP